MTSAQVPGSASPTSTSQQSVPHPQRPHSLRQVLEQRRVQGTLTPLQQAVEWIVPLCVEVASIHEQGYGLLLHPSNIESNAQGAFKLAMERAADPPATPGDQACMAPEVHQGDMGDERASVYAIASIFYELLTGQSVGPGMRRPSEIAPGLPRQLELVLGNALISDPVHRSGDLKALAQAIYQLAPTDNIEAPPSVDTDRVSVLGVDIDVSMSMMPGGGPMADGGPASGPAPRSGPGVPSSNVVLASAAQQGLGVGVVDARQIPRGDAATAELASLKARLESDPTPRYIVVKNGMDHGPFTAVELLQQIATHSFEADHELLDQKQGTQKPIGEWEEFAPFADHAQRHRDIQAEKAAIDRGVAEEKKQTRGKAFIGMVLVGVLLLGASTWFLTQVGTRSDEVAVKTETVSNIEAEGDVKNKKKAGGGKRSRVVGSQGGIPVLSGGLSCEAAQSAYVEEIGMKGGQADITRGQYAAIMNNGSYLNGCGVPSNVAVNVCAAVQNGRAVGVTVTTKPPHGSRSCISRKVRSMSFPSHPKLDVVRVSFAAQ